MADIFGEQTAANPLETLVGDGKKYATVEELAKAYAHADAAIEQRNRELAELRQELDTRLSVEEQLQRFKPTTNTGTPPEQPMAPTPPAGNPELKDEDLVARIRQVTQQEREQERINGNLNTVASKLVETYGSEEKAAEVVKKRAQELGVSVKFLEDVAAQSPKAFFTQLGLDNVTQPAAVTAPTRGTVNTQALSSNGGVIQPGTYEYYENLRKSDPKSYFTPKIQNQLMKDAMEGRYVPK